MDQNILLKIPRQALFVLLILFTSAPLFIKMPIPNKPNAEVQALFDTFNEVPEGGTVIIQSDWTESTRGENRGMMDAALRIFMRKNVKFALVSCADPQAPQVARNVVKAINDEREKAGERRYEKWTDYVEMGNQTNAEGFGQALRADMYKALEDKRDTNLEGRLESVMKSPVFEGRDSLKKVDLYLIITGTKSIIIAIERISADVKMAGMVTGVMGPETLNYHLSGQLHGLAAGLKGVYDLEGLMEEKWPGQTNLDKGSKYILTLHSAIFLLILAVIIGNIGVIAQKLGGKK